MKGRLRLGALLVAGALALPASASAEIGVQQIPVGGGVTLEAKVLRPAAVTDATPTPVVFDAGPYFGRFQTASEGRPDGEANPQPATFGLLEAGYTVVLVSLRGFGGSGGCWDFHGAQDRADMAAVVEWLDAQPWSNGRIAAAGFSYDGGAAADALAGGADLDAAILQAPQVRPYTSLFVNRLRSIRPYNAQAFGAGLSAADASGPAADGDQSQNLLTADPACWARNAAEVLRNDRTTAWWAVRSVIPGTDVPVLYSHGFQDDLVKSEALLELWSALETHGEAWLGQFHHTPADADEIWPADDPDNVGLDGYLEQKIAFLDRHLRDEEPAESAPRVVVQEGSSGGWRSEALWPPHDAAPTPPTLSVLPGSYVDKPGNTADARGNGATGNNPPAEQGAGTWTFSAPLAATTHLAGSPTLTVDTKATLPGAHVVALLYDIDENGMATMVTRTADEVDADGRNELTLYPQDWRFAAGHRIGLLISGGDDSLVEPAHTGQTVAVTGGTLRLPMLLRPHEDDLDGGSNWAISLRRPFRVEQATASRRTARRSRGLRVKRARRAAARSPRRG